MLVGTVGLVSASRLRSARRVGAPKVGAPKVRAPKVRAPKLGAPLLAAPLFVTLLGACAPSGVLVASGGEHRLSAHDEPSGVTVVLTSGVWGGHPTDLPEQWTILHALVANLGDEPVLLAPGDLELRDERGFSHELLDVGAAFALADPSAPVEPYGRQYHRDYDPGGPVEFEPIVPVGDTAEHALPWGVLEPGTQMRGFLYFESVEPAANAATLTWHVTRPDHARVVDLRFELFVARARTAGRDRASAPDPEPRSPNDGTGEPRAQPGRAQ